MAGRNYVVVIQAGGNGKRMLALTKNSVPKPMLPLNGKPMMEWQISDLRGHGITDFIIVVGHLGHVIKDYFRDGSVWDVHVSYFEEQEPLGSAGALYYLKERIAGRDVIFIFGDVMFSLDWNRFLHFHEEKGGAITLLAHPNAHPQDSDILIVNRDGLVTGIDHKSNQRDYPYKNCVNAGISIFSAGLTEAIDQPRVMDYEKDIVPAYINKGQVYAYRTPEYVKDAGTPDRFRMASLEQAQGVWSQKCLKNKQKCVFLDRDGTINRYKGLIREETQMELETWAAEAVRLLNGSGYLAIVITNQPVVARGMCTIEDVEKIHKRLETLLGEEGAYLDDILFCPHHPDRGFPEENPDYKIACQCRKPAPGLIHRCVELYNIDLSKSWMIGDTTVDVQTGINVGLKTILLLTGEAGSDGKYDVRADYTADNLLEAVKLAIKEDEKR